MYRFFLLENEGEKNLAVFQSLAGEFQYVSCCQASSWFATKLVLCCLEKLLGEIIPKDGAKCHCYPVTHSRTSLALGNLQLLLCCGGMIDTCTNVRCHDHVILNPGSQVIKLVSPS